MQFTKLFSRLINRISLTGKYVHLLRIYKAKKILKKLHEIDKTPGSHGKIIAYLRKINPYVFEELVLTAIENSNVYVVRNKRYSGDGGVDGIFKLKEGKVLVQCKRYKSYINSEDVLELSNEVKNRKYYLGVFVHTGRTGDKSRDIVKTNKNIIFISGNNLVDLLLGKIKISDFIENKLRDYDL